MSFRIAVVVGGPSPERGISLNSGRSVLDHLSGESTEVSVIYFDPKRQAYLLPPGQIYSNTPSDFDFRVASVAKSLSPKQLITELKRNDLVFPAIHGTFGEDGELQAYLESEGIPFVGSSSQACKHCFDKFNANNTIAQNGFFALPSTVLKIYGKDHREIVEKFFATHNITKAIVKPACGGSSIGVYPVNSVEDALEKAAMLFSKRVDTRVVVEQFATGIEFTTIILQNRFGLPVAVIPTEIEHDFEAHQEIFNYRKKYLPTRQVRFHCPPRFKDEDILKVQAQAEQLFSLFGMSDFARFDGWILDNREIWFSDFNPISGMEQNSFLFQQATRVGLDHRTVLQYVVESACRRHKLQAPRPKTVSDTSRKPVAVLMGGSNSERQVSLMSGTNVWLKLRRSKNYAPQPFLIDENQNVWSVPYAYLLNHTVEEVSESCRMAELNLSRLEKFERAVRMRLAVPNYIPGQPKLLPQKTSLEAIAKEFELVFIALHGGAGEDGTFQEFFTRQGVSFNGSRAKASKLCMDKFATGEALKGLEAEGIFIPTKKSVRTADIMSWPKRKFGEWWEETVKELHSDHLIVKPKDDGCSAGIVKLTNPADCIAYFEYLASSSHQIPAGRFPGQNDPVELPLVNPQEVIFEAFIDTDVIKTVGEELRINNQTGWVEVTVGVLEINGKLKSLNPSITIAEGEILSLEEKFQGGTGINITPPPEEVISAKMVGEIKKRVERVASILGIQGYSRIDIFAQRATGNIMVIEANSLPGLTPSTVLFHQGIAETPSLMPLDLLETIMKAGENTFSHVSTAENKTSGNGLHP